MGAGQDHRRRPRDAPRAGVQRLTREPTRSVLVPPERVRRWLQNFADRHGGSSLDVADGALVARGEDGALARLALPFGRAYDGAADPTAYLAVVAEPVPWGLLLVRRGGFAVAAGVGPEVSLSKVGRRHVQGRTKAGGQSQQRFARRRDNQARDAYAAAADHAHRILVDGPVDVAALVCGGDRAAVDAVLSDRRLSRLAALRTGRWLPVPDPRRSVLEQAVADARSVSVAIDEGADPGTPVP